MQAERRYVGLDVGGSAVKAGAVDRAGRVHGERSIALEPGIDPAEFERRLLGLLAELGRPEDLGGVGVGVPGLLDRARGVVTASPNLPYLEGLALRPLLARGAGVPLDRTAVENDANAAALGELWLGAARGERDALLVTLGTGVGGGLILGGRLHIGDGLAGEIGHVVVDPAGPPCGCGSRGCLETLASARAASARARERGLPARSPGDLERLAEAARAADGPERRLLREVGRDLGRGLATAVVLLDLRCFLFGGGFSGALDLLEPGIREGIAERAYGGRSAEIRLVPAALGPSAGWIGAARLVVPD